MKHYLALNVLAATTLLVGCGGTGSSAPAPTNVVATAADSRVVLTWDQTPGVNYWLFYAPASTVMPENCSAQPGCQAVLNASSPATISGLSNGITYSFTINGRINGGPGGPGSPSVSAIPQLAGANWIVGTALGVSDLRSVSYGTATLSGISASVFVASGGSGALHYSADGKSWTALTNPAPTANFNAIAAYGSYHVAVGSGGTILQTTDAVATTWMQPASGTTNDLFGVASNGSGGFVAVGAQGTILRSLDAGITWTVESSGTTSALHSVIYANGRYIAAGASGTLLTSTDGATWALLASPTLNDLKGLAYGYDATASSYTFVAVGAAGTVLRGSSDGLTWTAQTALGPLNLNAVTYGRQFIAVGDSGGIYTSADGSTWQTQAPSTANHLYGIAHGNFDYVAVGAAGLNLYAM